MGPKEEFQTIWTLSFFCCVFIASVVFCTSYRILKQLYCRNDSQIRGVHNRNFQPGRIRAHVSLSAVFSIVYCIDIISVFPICSRWSCHRSYFGYTFQLIGNFSYEMAAVGLHLIFINRLMNAHFGLIYANLSMLKCLLYIPLFVLIVDIMIIFIADVCKFVAEPDKMYHIIMICKIVYMVVDVLLCISTTTMFFWPMYAMNGQDVMRKYGIISGIQLMITIIADIFEIMRLVMMTNIITITVERFRGYWYIQEVWIMMDIMITTLCIYYGFFRQKRVVSSDCHQIPREQSIIGGGGDVTVRRKKKRYSFMSLFEMERAKLLKEQQRISSSRLDVIEECAEPTLLTVNVTSFDESTTEII